MALASSLMSLGADRPEFAPPPQRGTPRAVLLALLAHGLLIIALTWGVSWRREAEDAAIEAELWSSTAQQAAPRLTAPPVPTPPTPAPAPTPAPPPPPPPPPQARAPEPAPAPRAPDIALEREKKLKEQKERELEQQQQKKLEAAKKAAQEKKEQEARERAEDEAERKKEQQQKLAEAKKKQEAEAAKKKEADAKAAAQAAADRAATLKRMQGLAGASGDDNSKGAALKASGPSGGYGARIAAAVRPNIVYPDADLVSGNPTAEFDVNLAPDGTIVGVKLRKSSGLASWDDAAERGLRRTEKVPRDVDGRIFPSLTVVLQPKQR